MKEIESSANKNFKVWSSLLDSKGIQTHQLALISGKKVVMEVLQNRLNHTVALLMPSKPVNGLPKVAETYRLSTKLFKDLDIFGTDFPLLVVRIPEIPKWSKSHSELGCSLLLMQQDPRNVGAILRSAAAFGVNQIILGPGCAHPFHPASTRAASGCVFDHQYTKLGSLDFADLTTVALDMNGENMADFIFPKNFILVPGVEGPGLAKNFEPTKRVNIRIERGVESLNVMQATTIALYEWAKQRG